MEQTFHDLLRERAEQGQGLLAYTLSVFVETAARIFREHLTAMRMRHKKLIYTLLGTTSLLLVPFLGGWPWTLSDYVSAGTLLASTGIAYGLLTRKGGNTAYRFAVSLAVGAGLLLTWINLSVGIIGNESNPANLMYFGVIAVAFIGTLITRSRPAGMARALFATSLAQLFVPVLAFLICKPLFTTGLLDVLVLNGFFAALFAGSALLFRSVHLKTAR